MQCPQCKQPMLVYDLDGIEIDSCPNCGGSWLDAGEIEDLCHMAGVEPGPLSLALGRPGYGARPGARPCPRCRKPMLLFELASGGGLTLDRCPAGQGFWFDRGELRELVETFGAGHGESAVVGRLLGEMFKHDLESG